MATSRTTLTFVLFLLTLSVILSSSYLAERWPASSYWVTVGLLVFAALLFVVAIIGRRRTT
jgi:hypothetical protein